MKAGWLLAEPGCPSEAPPKSLNRAQIRQGSPLDRESPFEQVRMLFVKLNQFRLLRRRTEEAGAFAGDREALGADQVEARRAVQSELAQRIPEAVFRVAELFDAPPIGRPGVIADRFDHPSAGPPAPQGWLPVIAELVLRCDFPLQAAALAAVSKARQGACPPALIFQALVRNANPAPAHHD